LIYPSRAAVLAAIGGIPFALLVAAAAPQLWYASLAWPAAVLLMTLLDALLSAGTGAATVETPARLYVGETADLVVHIKVQGRRPPTAAGVALSANDLLDLPDDGRAWASLEVGSAAVPIPATAVRRGVAGIDRLWLRWRGPLGLVGGSARRRSPFPFRSSPTSDRSGSVGWSCSPAMPCKGWSRRISAAKAPISTRWSSSGPAWTAARSTGSSRRAT
jgi:uncharacterized protein (DUF58 family)